MVIQRQRDAGKKVSRINRQQKVDLGAHGLDPRVDRQRINRYNESQLRNQLNKLDAFQSRGTQYVADAHRRPMNKSTWNEYKRAERAYNRVGQKQFDKFKDVQNPTTGMTVGERAAMVTPKHPTAGTQVGQTSMKRNMSPRGAASEKHLKKLTADLKRKTSPEYHAKRLRKWRTGANKMIGLLGRPDIKKAAKGLTAEQFAALWQFTDFAQQIEPKYQIHKSRKDGKASQQWMADRADRALDKALKQIEWAKTL